MYRESAEVFCHELTNLHEFVCSRLAADSQIKEIPDERYKTALCSFVSFVVHRLGISVKVKR